MKNSFFILLLITLLSLAFSCENEIKKVKLITSIDSIPDQTVDNFSFIQTEYGKMIFKLTSPKLYRYQLPEQIEIFPKGMQIEMYDSLKHLTSKVTCNWSKRWTKKKIMEGKNNVVVINVKGEKLNTEHIIWDSEKDLLYSEAKVKITTSSEVLFGVGFESNSQFTHYKIKHLTGSVYSK